MKKPKTDNVDLNTLSPEQRERVERALHPRDTVFSLKFCKRDVDKWHEAADAEGSTLTDWVERLLCDGAEKSLRKSR